MQMQRATETNIHNVRGIDAPSLRRRMALAVNKSDLTRRRHSVGGVGGGIIVD
jgi:hypothetical protein